MLIYDSSSSNSSRLFNRGSSHYKSADTQIKSSNRSKSRKRTTAAKQKPKRKQRQRQQAREKVKSRRKLSANNIKFLKKLGLRVRQH